MAQCMEEIKEELRQENMSVKANAVAKLTYVSIDSNDGHGVSSSFVSFRWVQLQMLGYDISWAAFNIIEVMSSTKFTYKVCMDGSRVTG